MDARLNRAVVFEEYTNVPSMSLIIPCTLLANLWRIAPTVARPRTPNGLGS